MALRNNKSDEGNTVRGNAFSSSPTVNGEIVSTMTSLKPWIEFMLHIRNCARHIEESKLRPELIYNKLPVIDREEDTIGQEYYADADDFPKCLSGLPGTPG